VIILGLALAVALLPMPETFDYIAFSVLRTLAYVIWSIFLLRVTRAILRFVAQDEQRMAVLRPQTLPLFENLAIILIVVLSVYVIFTAWDIDMTAWLASAGIVGIAVGFAAKDTLSNLFSGVFIIADAPYKVGDYIVLDTGGRGKVVNIGLRSTRILTRDDIEVTIPNSIIGNSMIINQSGGPYEKMRVRLKIGVAYGSDVDHVKKILVETAAAEPLICSSPEPRIRFRQFGASSLDFELLFWVNRPEDSGRALDAMNTAVYKRLNEERIEIPYAKQDLYIKGLPEAFSAFVPSASQEPPAGSDQPHSPDYRL
jgi:small-conductance mechanosensitive channel